MWDYTDKVKELFFNPKNSGVLEDADGVGDVGAISCGDALRLMIKVDKEKDVITDARFQTFGCGSAIASSSALTELIIGQKIEDALKITNQDIANSLGGLPPEKMHCSVMGYEALRAAVANYRGEAWSDDHEEGALICKCFGIDEGMIERAVRMNKLTTTDQVTHYTKAAGSCGTCVEGLESVLYKTNHAMVEEGLITAAEAFKLGAPAPSAKPVSNTKPVTISAAVTKPAAAKSAPAKAGSNGKLTNLQRIKVIEGVIDDMRPVFKRDGGDCDLVDVDGDHVYVRLTGACNGCQMENLTLNGIRERLSEALGRMTHVVPVHGKH
ncbi:MAG: Nitrogen fixation protein nifU [Pseudomonadota bacterium]|jgi:NifU-like protein